MSFYSSDNIINDEHTEVSHDTNIPNASIAPDDTEVEITEDEPEVLNLPALHSVQDVSSFYYILISFNKRLKQLLLS